MISSRENLYAPHGPMTYSNRKPLTTASPAHDSMPRAMWRVFTRLALAAFGLVAATAQAATTDAGLKMEVVTAYNFVVDSNIESPAGKSPSAAHLGVKISNTGGSTLTNVVVNIGDLIDPLTSAGAGTFESRTVNQAGQYAGTFQLEMPSGAADAVRVIPSLAPGASVVQYFFVVYPLKDGSGNSVTGSAPVPEDDLWLNYDIWAYATDGLNPIRRVDQTTKVTMRNEISAMANKIWPNGDNKVPDEYLDVIEAALGWRPSGVAARIPGAQVSEGIWYDLGNVGAGFDNNGDGIPDRNAWLQPVGDPAQFNALAARMVKCYGIVIVKLNDGTEQLIPFEDELYFENMPANNTGAVGLVYYEFLPLNSTLPSKLTPYQEVASGYDNEKFNGDYGTVTGSIDDTPVADIQKTGPSTIVKGNNANYTIVATNTGTVRFGWPELGMPVVIEDPIPAQLQYVTGTANTASNVTSPAGGVFTVYYSTNNGTSWTTTEPVPASSVNRLRWVLDRALAPTDTATVLFSATVPSGFTGSNFTNTAILKLGTVTEIDRDDWPTILTGNNSLGDFVWRDLDRDGVQDGGAETGIDNIGVSLYIDSDGDGVLDSGEPLYGTTSTSGGGGYGFSSLPDGRFIVVVDNNDADLPTGFTLPNSATTAIAVALDPTATNPSAVSVLTADWPFIPALEILKSVTPTTYGEGELVDFTIDLENHSAPVAAPSNPLQTSWSTTVASAGNRTAVQLPANAQGVPNNASALMDWSQGGDRLTTSGGYSFPDQTGTITKVELLIYGYLNTSLTNDTMNVILGATTLSDFVPTTTLNTWTGSPALRVLDITSNVTLTFAAIQALTIQLEAQSKNSKDGAIIYIDSIGIRVTATASTPSSGTYGQTSIAPLPLTDTFDNTKLAFVSASIAPTSVSGGTITWADVGPLNPGVRKTITVTFRTLATASTTTTTNTATATNAYFVSGRRTNDDTDDATITINPRGSIGDRVWWDKNANGVQEGGEPGLENVLVTLSNGAQTRTDANGNYLFSGLVDAEYTVTVVSSTLPSGFTQTYDANGTGTQNNSTLTITGANDNLLQDFGYDSALNIISGSIFMDYDGDGVQDPGDNFLSGVTVTLSGQSSATTTTDANGFYIFSSLADGNYTVTVTQPGSIIQTLDPDGAVKNNATSEAASGGNIYPDNDFAYQPSGALTLGDTVYYDWNGDGDQDAGEGGIANVDVFLYKDTNGNGVIDVATDAYIATSVTNASGVYGFGSLVNGYLIAGNYLVIVNTADPQFPANVTQKQDFDGVPDSKATVNLVASRSDVDFGYQPSGTNSLGNLVWLDSNNDGKSWFDDDNDNIKDAGESFKPGIDGVTVELYHNGQTPGTDTAYRTTTTSGGGFYSFSSLPDGSYYVYIKASNFGSGQPLLNYPWSSTNTDTADNQQDNDDNGAQSVKAGATTSPLIALSATESDQTIDFGFTGTASIGDTVFYDLNGNGNLDYAETGINGVTMELYLDETGGGPLFDQPDGIPDGPVIDTEVTATVSGLVGYYKFSDLPPNTYIVKVLTSTLPAGLTQTADPDLDGIPVNNNDVPTDNDGDHADTSIVLFSGSNYPSADFGYQPAGSIGDYVWLDVNRDGVQDLGEPGIAGVVVRVTSASLGLTYNITTDTDGYWAQVVADAPDWVVSVPTPPAGRVIVYDAQSGIVSPDASVPVTVSGGLVTVPAGLAQGNMGLDFGYALNGIYSLSGTVAINDDGVALPNLGKHNDIDDFIDDGTDYDVGPNDETELENVLVYLYSSTGTFLGSTFTDAGGNYQFTNLPNGAYRVIIGTTAPPLDRATLTTTAGNYPPLTTTVTNTGTTVIQVVTIAGANLYDIDFMFDPTVNYDFGDLPATYGMTGLGQDGARHIIPGGSPTLWLGTNAPDTEINGISNAQALGDDILGTDDEDGVTAVDINSWADGLNGNSNVINVDVHGSGYLVGWIDWNHDKDFLDDGEFVVSQAVTTGNVPVILNIPLGTITAASESWLSRFRLFPDSPEFPVFSYVGEATNGEVEDHLFQKTVGASIGDLVWIDTDGNGSVNGTEAGLGGVLVELRASNNVTILATQTTSDGTQDVDGDGVIDPVGYYRFTELAAATYNVTIPIPPVGYTPSYDENGIGTPNTTQKVLGGTEQHLTADFGYAPQLANLSGTVYFDTETPGAFSGGDTPSPFVRVQLFTDPNGDGNPSDGVQVRETYTNASGYYEFLAVPTGNYVVVEVNPPGATSVLDVAVSAIVPISTATDDRIPVTMVGTNITGRDFLDTQPAIYSIAGTVYDDSAANNNTIDDGVDARVAGVTVNLYIDRDGNGVYTTGEILRATTTTNSTGDYSFSGLYPGDYAVQKINPAVGVINDWDSDSLIRSNDSQIGVEIVDANIVERNFLIDGYHGSISNFTWYDADLNGQQNGGETGLDGVTVTLYRYGVGADGIPSTGDDNNAVATATTAGGGFYSFTGLPPGTYQVNFGDLLTHNLTTADTGNDATDSDANATTGQTGNIVLDPGEVDTSIDAGYKLDTCPDDWAEWKAQHPSEGPTGSPAANTDADNYDNLAEFAFHMPYDSGIGSTYLDHTAWIVRESTIAPGTLEGVFVRPTGAYLNVVYKLQYAATIGDPTVWQTLTITPAMITTFNNGDCTEIVTIHGLESLTGLIAGKGVVRIRAELDDNGGYDQVDHITYTEPEGWTRTGLAVCGQTYNNPYARESVYTGTISAVSGQQISFAGEQLLLTEGVVEAGWTYYIEVETGVNEGHRYDVASTSAGSLTLASDADLHVATAPFNTTTTAPPQTLVGAKVSLRRHWKLAEMFPPLKYVPTLSQTTADQVQVFVQGAWKIYWLYNQNDADPNTAIWVDAADPGNANQGALIIPPGQGVLFNNRGVARSQLSYGEIRVNDFIRPLPIGRSFVGGGYPLDQYAANHPDVPATAPGRQMTKAVGFFGSRDFTKADSFFLWNADITSAGRSYSTYFFHDATPRDPALIRWVVVGDNIIQIRDEEVHFKSDRAVFIRTKNGLPVYTIPSPWAP